MTIAARKYERAAKSDAGVGRHHSSETEGLDSAARKSGIRRVHVGPRKETIAGGRATALI